MRATRTLDIMDVDVGGDLHRIVLGGVRPCPGDSIRARMDYLERQADGLRRLLISEPLGNPSMCVDLVMPAVNPEAQLGFVIMEVMGYPYYSGSNTIATATAVLEAGLIPIQEGDQTVRLESPGGVATVVASSRGGRVESVTTRGGAAYVQALGQQIDVPGIGLVHYDLVWSGGYYVLVDAAELGFTIDLDSVAAMTSTADAIIRSVQMDFAHHHPELGDVGLPRFLHFMGPLEQRAGGGLRSASATYGHPGIIWRCPTGTGTSARLALLASRGDIAPGTELETVSPWGNAFAGRITDHARVGDFAAVDSTITARPRPVARLALSVYMDGPEAQEYGLNDILSEPD